MIKSEKQFCKNGHDKSIVGSFASGVCKECRRIYVIENKLKIKEIKKQWYINNKETIKPIREQYLINNVEEIKEYFRLYRLSHLEKIKKWKEDHKKEIQEYNKEYIQKHPELKKIYNIKNHTNRNLRLVSWGQEAIKYVYKKCPDNKVVDHIIPLQGDFVSGFHVSWNLQYLTKSQNSSKGNRCDLITISDWYGKILEEAGLK